MKNLKTKLSYTLYILLVAFLFTGCGEHNPKNESEFKIIVVDSCEYIYSYEGVDEGALFTHKGNCKFCSELSK
jgi:hypothetical protein